MPGSSVGVWRFVSSGELPPAFHGRVPLLEQGGGRLPRQGVGRRDQQRMELTRGHLSADRGGTGAGHIDELDVAPQVSVAARFVHRASTLPEFLLSHDPVQSECDHRHPPPGVHLADALAEVLAQSIMIDEPQRSVPIDREVFRGNQFRRPGVPLDGTTGGHDDTTNTELGCRLEHVERGHHIVLHEP